MTWRPRGTRLAVAFFGTLLVVFCAFAWFGFDPEIRARFTPFQRGTILVLGGLLGAVFYALARSRVTAATEGLTVVNGYRTRTLEWAEVVSVHLPPGAPWAVFDLADGTTLSALGIQGVDGDRAADAVRRLRRLLDA